MKMRWAVCGLFLAFLLSTTLLLAQETLLSADYGSKRNRVDVTSQVQSLVRNGWLNFKVSNDALGGDPAPGQVKDLRIHTRVWNGSTRNYNVREGQTINLQLTGGGTNFPGWRPGGYRGALRGDDQRRFDSYYTRWLNYKRTNNRGEVQSMEKRMLGIYSSYRIPYDVPFSDVASPGLGQPDPGWGGGGNWNSLQIISARYGEGHRMTDVTGRVQSLVRNNYASFRVNNDSMGGDPAPGRVKRLEINYRYQGRQRRITVPENSVASLP